MGDDKSIRQRIADAVKDIANIAGNAANDALKAETPKPETRKSKSDEAAASYIPLAAEGLVSDPMLVPPLAAARTAKKKRGAAKPAAKKAVRKTAKKATKKSTVGKSKKRTGQTAKRAAKKTTNTIAKKNKKRAVAKVGTPTRRSRAKA